MSAVSGEQRAEAEIRSVRRRILLAATMDVDKCLAGVSRYGRQHGWHIATDMLVTGAFPRGWQGDGIVAVNGFRPEIVKHIEASNIPYVSLCLNDEISPGQVIKGDDYRVGRMAAAHLLERAFRSFAWAPFINDPVNRERYRGFESTLLEHCCIPQILPPAHRRIGAYWHDDWAGYRSSLSEKLQALPRPTAIFAANDCVASEILDLCVELGIRVPDEIAVLGVGNTATLCDSLSVPLSSVELAVDEMAFLAAARLDALIKGERLAEAPDVAPKGVVTRLSTDICAVANSQVARALTYIAEQFGEASLGVGEIADAVGLSRRQLERVFRSEVGCTVHDHIIKRRMQEASRLLLKHPRAKVKAIAELVGFDGSGTFFRTFRKYYGESPRQHRLGAAGGAELRSEDKESRRASA